MFDGPEGFPLPTFSFGFVVEVWGGWALGATFWRCGLVLFFGLEVVAAAKPMSEHSSFSRSDEADSSPASSQPSSIAASTSVAASLICLVGFLVAVVALALVVLVVFGSERKVSL